MLNAKLVVAFIGLTTATLLCACDPQRLAQDLSGSDALCTDVGAGDCQEPYPSDP